MMGKNDTANIITYEELLSDVPCRGEECYYHRNCGKARLNPLTAESKPRIINGQAQIYGEWPSYVRLLVLVSDYAYTECGDVLLSERSILRTEHCFAGHKISGILAIAGESIQPSPDKYEQVGAMMKVRHSKRFNHKAANGRSGHDYAVLRVVGGFQLTDYVQPACLPFNPLPLEKAKCFVVGLGSLDASNVNDPRLFPRVIQKMRFDVLTVGIGE